jgi:type VI secretion system protein VasD
VIRARLATAALALVLLATACASGPAVRPECPAPRSGELVLEASDHLNPDRHGAALPTEVRLYQLRDAASLEHASFEDVWQDAAAALGDAIVSEESVTVYPGQTIRRQLRAEDDAHVIAAVVIVREPAGNAWRAVVSTAGSTASAPPDDRCAAALPPRLTFRIEGYRIEAIARLEGDQAGP